MGPDVVLVLVAILAILLITRGPSMLPRLGEALGRTVRSARTEIPSALRDEPAPAADDPAARSAERPDERGGPPSSFS